MSQLIWKNIKESFSQKYSLLSFFIPFALLSFIFLYLTDYVVIKGNLGMTYYIAELTLQFSISLLFSLFVLVSVHKYIKFSSFSTKEGSTSFLGTFFGVLVAGCPACSITLATYIGLGSLVSLLPWYGLELKILGVLLLMYALYISLQNLQTCKLDFKKKVHK